MTKSHLKVNYVTIDAAVIVLITFFYYHNSLNNFFYADDFIWLDRIKHLNGNLINILNLENGYFTPLTYVSFYVSFKMFGLNPYWYHLTDVTIHALNGLMLYVLAYRISANRLTSFISSVLFVTSYSTIIAVVWSSARTDLLMVSLSLATIISFTNNKSQDYRFMPLFLYVLALCAKGTALVLPLVIFLVMPKDKPLKLKIIEIIPYLVVNTIYAIMLMISSSFSKKNITAPLNISFMDFSGPLSSLVVPERLLADVDNLVLGLISTIILLALALITYREKNVTVKLGTALTVCGLLPLLTKKYILIEGSLDGFKILASPSNRLYLACTGISLVYAALLSKFIEPEKTRIVRLISVTLLVSILCFNYYENALRLRIWSKRTENTRYSLERLKKNSSMLTDNSNLLLYNFEGSSGFIHAMISVFYDKNIKVNNFFYDYVNILANPDHSPLANSRYNNSRLKIIMNCSAHPWEDMLMRDSNVLLQSILEDYRYLSERSSIDKTYITRNRLEKNMAQLKRHLTECASFEQF